MYISKLRITNFRTFSDPAFEIILKPFTLILGENNIGKTNLVSAIALLFGQDLSSQHRRVLELDDINYQAVQAFKRQVADEAIKAEGVVFPEVVVEAVLSEMNDEQHSVIGDWYSDTKLDTATVTYRFSVRGNFDRVRWVEQQREGLAQHGEKKGGGDTNSDKKGQVEADEATTVYDIDFPIREYRYSIFGGGVESNECDAQFLQMLRVELLDALRDANRELIAGGEQRLLYRILSQKLDVRYRDLKSALMAVQSAVDDNKALKDVKDQVAELLKRVSLVTRADDNRVEFQFTAPDATELLKKIGLIYGSDPVTVARNGLGRNNLLYVALVVSQIAQVQDVSSADERYVCFRCVGIEEPEAHLHPHLQDHLAANIESIRKDHSDRLQLLLTSHSTHLAAKLSLENTVVMFEREDGTLGSHYVLSGLDVKKDKDSIRFLSLYLDATKSRLLFARRTILVEGIAEQVLIPLLFSMTHAQTLESLGVSVVNVNGVAFKHFLRICQNGLFKRCVVLTDQDTDTKTEERADKLKCDFDDGTLIKVCISKESTFEKDLISANQSGDGKSVILDAIIATRPVNGKALKAKTGNKALDVEECFAEIEEHKAAFAFNLVAECSKSNKVLTAPDYINEAFSFLTNTRAVGDDES